MSHQMGCKYSCAYGNGVDVRSAKWTWEALSFQKKNSDTIERYSEMENIF